MTPFEHDVLSDQIVFSHEVPARSATFGEWSRLDPRLLATLPARPFSHQADAVAAARSGRDVLVVTGTNSGKSLCFQVPALAACMEEPLARALFIYPTKALAQDQAARLTKMSLDLGIRVSTYDGDTPKSHRSSIRNLSHIVLTNPDMLHTGILPTHAHWTKFLKALRVIAIDELHAYRGVFGSHVALILRRLLRLCAMHHNRPQIIAGSATIGNPEELFERLCGRSPLVVDQDGSPSGKRSVIFLNPPQLPSGERLSTNITTSEVVSSLVETGVSTLAFNRSRVATELVLRYTRKRLPDSLASQVESYRAGYTAKERRQIEQDLVKGRLKGLSATNALELGIDIGSLDAVVLNGYPGSVASFWQQAGRAGRGDRDGLAIYIAGDNPLEQYLLSHPGRILDSRSESVSIQPTNPSILSAQLLCAAHERPISPSELSEFVDGALDVAEEMDRAGELTFSGGHFYYPAYDPPALKVNIRGAGRDSVTLRVGQEEIGSMEYERALSQAHTGAIYLHRGEPFEVAELNLETKNAELVRFAGNYYSQARIQSMLVPRASAQSGGLFHLSGCTVTDLVVAFAKKSFDGDTVLDVVNLDLPEVSFDTVCVRIDLPSLHLDETLDQQIAGIHGVEHAILALAPLFAGCDRGDIGSAWFTHFVHTGNPAIFLFDRTPGGVGIAELLFQRAGELVQAAYEQVKNCSCESGCPSCLLLAGCEVGNEQLDKLEAVSILRRLSL